MYTCACLCTCVHSQHEALSPHYTMGGVTYRVLIPHSHYYMFMHLLIPDSQQAGHSQPSQSTHEGQEHCLKMMAYIESDMKY